MRVLYLDCFSGASGDMLLGAFLDLGVPLDELRAALGSLAVEELPGRGRVARYDLRAERVVRAGVSATKFRLVETATGQPADAHHHHHHHHHRPGGDAHAGHGAHAHRGLAEVRALVEASAVSPGAKARAVALFTRLAEAEAAIHGLPVDRVHFHEVGALDSIVDIVGCVFALEWLGVDEVIASPLNTGSGTVSCAHGVYPVPAPATARLVAGVPVYAQGPAVELLTPTGALIVTGYASTYGPLPAMTVERIGYGAGERDFAGRPNVLRAWLGRVDAAPLTETLVVMACEIDDMNPQLYGSLLDRLHGAGALEVNYQPVQMKKNRPGTLVTVLVDPTRRQAVADVMFRETTTLGVRYHEVRRDRLEREIVDLTTRYGVVRAKVARRGGGVVNAMPEFDDCARLAASLGLPVKDVHAAACAACQSLVAPADPR